MAFAADIVQHSFELADDPLVALDVIFLVSERNPAARIEYNPVLRMR